MPGQITIEKQIIANIHNAIAQMHYTGGDIIIAAALLTDLEKLLQEEPKQEVKENG